MIFITLGSQKFQFNRLLKEIDRLVNEQKITEKIYAQIGYSDYLPQFFLYDKFFDREEYERVMQQSEIVITHAGTGAIIGAVTKGKKVIAVPRLARYGEHVDDHQLEILKQFDEMNIICPCYDCEDLEQILSKISTLQLVPYESNNERMIEELDRAIKYLVNVRPVM